MDIEVNPQFEQTLRFVNETKKPIFLTGKAGTGKTTLLKYIKANTYKQMAVVAPTGVAAINAGGSTIHSFFQFPFNPFLPALAEDGSIDIARTKMPQLKHNTNRLNIFRNLELLVIDEISMVRADLLDQIDITLRITRKRRHLPFGGVQVLLIGDMYQLPPVVQREEWSLLKEVYKSPFFFESRVIKQFPPVYIELEKIYRQNEVEFIHLLNKVRNNELDEESLTQLNSHYKPNLTQEEYQSNITLTTHNRKADEINTRNLEALPDKAYRFRCEITGSFSEKNFPADEELALKKGTRVMFLKNNADKNYYNGKIGIITQINSDGIWVKCDEDENEIEVNREVWENISYQLDPATKHINEERLGTFTQYPLRLAWAITIHKSQGLTFDKLIIDAAESFNAGQVYVALSRCRSLNGLTLSSRISPRALMNDNNILNFANTKQSDAQVNDIFFASQRDYMKVVLMDLFDLSEQIQSRKAIENALREFGLHLNSEGVLWSKLFFEKLLVINEISEKFKVQLSGLIDSAPDIEHNAILQERIKKAAVYFEVELKKILDELRKCALVTESKEAATVFNENLQEIFDALYQKHALTKKCGNGFVFSDFTKNKLNIVYPNFKMNVYASAKNTVVSADINNPELYRELLQLRDEICARDGKPIYLVASKGTLIELANFLPETIEDLQKISGFGKAKAEAYGHDFLDIIKAYMYANNIESNISSKQPKRERKAGKEKTEKIDTKAKTFQLYKQGLSVAEIAEERRLTAGTVEGHLFPYVVSGELHLDDLLPKDKISAILEAIDDIGTESGLAALKNRLPETISYNEIKFVLATKTGLD